MNPYDRVPPRQALAEAAGVLSRTNPRNAWSLCALLSVTEAFAKTPEELLFLPVLNQEKVRLLCEAVIDSKALDYKAADLTVDQIIDALKYANRALADVETVQLVEDLRAAGESELALRFFMARLGNIQLRYQDPRFHERVGRLIGMFESLPRSHRSKMPAEFWALADPTIHKIREFLEFPIFPLAVCIQALTQQYEKPYEDILARYL